MGISERTMFGFLGLGWNRCTHDGLIWELWNVAGRASTGSLAAAQGEKEARLQGTKKIKS